MLGNQFVNGVGDAYQNQGCGNGMVGEILDRISQQGGRALVFDPVYFIDDDDSWIWKASEKIAHLSSRHVFVG